MTTVYLDMANWIDLAEGNVSAQEFDRAVSDKLVEPVLSFTHLLELANQEESGWRRVSSYIDFIRRIGKTHWMRIRGDIERLEVESAFARFLGIQPPRFSPFKDSLVETLPSDPNVPITENMRTDSVQNQVESLWTNDEYVNMYLPERAKDFPEIRKGSPRPPRERLLDFVPTTPPPGKENLVVDDQVCRDFASSVDLASLPAFSLVMAFNQGWEGQMGGRQISDYDDHLHLAGIAYSDVSFADRRTCGALQRGRAKIMPMRNGKQFEEWTKSLA